MFNISDRIRYYRKKKGLTQMQVATALGIRTDNYTKYESGARVPKDDRLIALSKILGVSYNALHEGIEQEFISLLYRHAVGSIVGEAGSFSAFANDMETSPEAYGVISEFFGRSDHYFAANNEPFYQQYLARPNLPVLISLHDMYREQCDSDPSGQPDDNTIKPSYSLNGMDDATTAKWAFCIAVKKYLDQNDTATILDESEKLAENLLEHMDALQFFALKVFVPYLSLIIDAVDLCMNTTIDDFENAFLFYALTPPDEEQCDDNDGEDD